MRKLLAAAAGCAIIACMLFSLLGQDKPYKDVTGESFKVIVQLDSSEQLRKAFRTNFRPVRTERVADSVMLTFEFSEFDKAEEAYLELKRLSEAVYIEGGMHLSDEQAEVLLNEMSFKQSGDIYFCREQIQSILRRTSSGYYLTTGYPYIISGC